MSYKPTYKKLYNILTSNPWKANKDCNFQNLEESWDIYFEYLLKNWYLIESKDEKIHFIWNYNLSNKSKIFIDKYKTLWWKVEYFFKDYPFLWSIIIWFFWWAWATILNMFLWWTEGTILNIFLKK